MIPAPFTHEQPQPTFSETAPMQAARRPRKDPRGDRLLVVDTEGAGGLAVVPFAALPSLLDRGDVLVVNDAGTRPSSLQLVTIAGARTEARLFDERDDGTFAAVLFGAGD